MKVNKFKIIIKLKLIIILRSFICYRNNYSFSESIDVFEEKKIRKHFSCDLEI